MKTLRFGLVGFIAFLAITLALITFADSAIIRVKTNGNDANSGASWVLAKKTVQGAINAGNAGDEIWVAAGTYQENIQNKIVNIGGTDTAVDMALYGGFAGTETNRNERNWLTNLTILDGNNSGNVVTISAGAGPETRVDGFYILNGSTGISSSNSGPTITNNVIGRNSSSGIYLANYKFTSLSGPFYFPIVTLNTILSNTSSYGAGIHIFGARGLVSVPSSAPQITHNTIAWNTAGTSGGGIGSYGHSSPYIANNTIFANSCAASAFTGGGGGIYSTALDEANNHLNFAVSAPVIINNVVAANGGGQLTNAVHGGGGIHTKNTDIGVPIITNNTVVANHGAGIWFSTSYGDYAPKIQNNLVAFNTWGLEQFGAEYAPTIKNNLVYGNTLQGKKTDYQGIADQTGVNGNISSDPKVTNHRFGQFHLQPGSPCIDAGANDAVEAGWKDIDMLNRVSGSAVDIGADEYDGTLWNFPVPIIHVWPGGDDSQDGLTWGTAKKTVTAGISSAMVTSGEVWVAAGTYAEHIVIPAFVYLYGGFLGNESSRDSRDVANNVAILDGGGVHGIVRSKNAGYLVSAVDGFTIQNGGVYTNGNPNQMNGAGGLGGGINISVASPYIVNNTIKRNSLARDTTPGQSLRSLGGGIYAYLSYAEISGNTISENEVLNYFDGQGGGIYCVNSLPTIKNNTITQNRAKYGSAIYCETSAPSITDNLIENNSMYNTYPAYTYWGSLTGAINLYLGQEEFLIQGNTIRENTAGQGAGICVTSNAAGRIQNNLIYDNTAKDPSAGGGTGGGIYAIVNLGGILHILNNTIVGNKATYPPLPPFPPKEEGGAISVAVPINPAPPPYPGQLFIANNIIAFNSSGIFTTPAGVVPPTLTKNDVYPLDSVSYINLSAGTTDIHVDPGFVNQAGGDFHLTPTSLCIDAGDNASVPAGLTKDYEGKPRIWDGNRNGVAVVDMGAYELTFPVTIDFNNDGKRDILWRNPTTGQNLVWYMNGTAVTGPALLDSVNDGNWKIVGTGDFNGDGKTDILWRNPATGQNLVWYMNGTAVMGPVLLDSVNDANWEIVGTGDFSNDSKPDILWRNPVTGQNAVWYMNGTTVSGFVLLDSVSDANWKIVGTGDFNNDSKPDILWRNPVTGQNAVWYMNGTTVSGFVLLDSVSDANWKIVGTGDFNNDSKTDILWRNPTTGQNAVWLLNGTAVSGFVLLDSVSDANWEIVGR